MFRSDYEEAVDAVNKKVRLLHEKVKELGLYVLAPNKSKDTICYPKIFTEQKGENVHKFISDFQLAISSDHVRKKDECKTLMKYLGGEASLCIGEHTSDLTEACALLKSTFGNPMIIWNQKKEAIADTLGNFGIWGKANSLERRNAIIQMIDFINEATTLATEHSKLRNEINSESTYRDIFVLLPNNICEDVLEKIDPEKPVCEKAHFDEKPSYFTSEQDCALP